MSTMFSSSPILTVPCAQCHCVTVTIVTQDCYYSGNAILQSGTTVSILQYKCNYTPQGHNSYKYTGITNSVLMRTQLMPLTKVMQHLSYIVAFPNAHTPYLKQIFSVQLKYWCFSYTKAVVMLTPLPNSTEMLS